MVKSELVQALCNKLPIHNTHDVELAVNWMIELMVKTLQSGHRIEIRDFGSFHLRQRSPRIACNPKTGEPIAIPSKTVVHFKPGKEMCERVNVLGVKPMIRD